MKPLVRLSLSCLGAVLLANAQSGSPDKPAVSGVDLKAIDKTVDPCKDFFQYACGAWIKANPIPPQYSRWGRFNELQDRNLDVLHQILEDSAAHQDRSPADQKIGAMYASCMNEDAVEKAGFTPIKPGLDQIAGLKDKAGIAGETAQLHEQGVGVFFGFSARPDPDKSTVNIPNASQGGLGLPDKSYYIGEKDAATREKYVSHIGHLFELIGIPREQAEEKAKAVMALETSLAKVSMDRVDMRNPDNTHHKMSVEQWESLTPDFDFKQYMAVRKTPAFQNLNVSQPDYFKAMAGILQSTSLDDLKSYLTWHYVSANASLLSKPFVDENFDFYTRFLTGAKEIQPRWKRCVQLTDRSLGDALGQKYVEKAFGSGAKEKTQQLVGVIEKQMAVDIDSLTWMSAATKEQALAKLKGVTNKIGYPEKWKTYRSVTIKDGDLVGDAERARAFEINRNLQKIGQAVDRKEFNMTPPTVNAYYSPLENNINFPAGILQPPFYNNSADMAVNLGGIGAVIGHELTHGFDDQGRRYDADGNLRDWWTQQDTAEFKKRADCIVDEYSKFSPVEGATVNGRLTLGENGADNAGIRLAYMALLGGLENGSVHGEKMDGYTPQQRFFLGFAQIWCANERPEALRQSIRTDPHSPGQFRVLGTLQNQPEFGKAFGCSAGSSMVAANGCRVW